MKKVVVIGAGGHIGLPLSACIANSDQKHRVTGFELDDELIDNLNQAILPFEEPGLLDRLEQALNSGRIWFQKWDDGEIQMADFIIIIIGTPIDEEGNPRMTPLFDIADKLAQINTKAHIILRSTLSPGTTKVFTDRLNPSKDRIVAFCPERVAQGKFFDEIHEMPQAIGIQQGPAGAYKTISGFFDSFSAARTFECTALEAELGKLFTNMARYVEFAVANEFQMIAESFDVDGANILEKFKRGYPRLNIAAPGPNVGGPCLFKDGKFLLKNMEGTTIIDHAYRINEGMPAYIIKQMKKHNIHKTASILVLGAAFKKDNDDTRNSLSFKLMKLLNNEGYKWVEMFDKHVVGYEKVPNYFNYDCIILMTPHSNFDYSEIINKAGKNTVFIDLWKVMNRERIVERKK